MSKMRPECGNGKNSPCPSDDDALYMIREAVRDTAGLGYGYLNDPDTGFSCAIGTFFNRNPKLALHSNLIDEVAAYNDSIPKHVAPRTRRNRVLAWLNWKLDVLANRLGKKHLKVAKKAA